VEGFDLNRDSTYQTQIESQVATADLVKWKPVTMDKYGLIGHTAYVAENKNDLYLNQLEFFRRALNNEESPETEKWFVTQDNQVEENFREKDEYGKFYPEYYVIPTDAASQRDIADAYFMQEYFIRNGVQVEKLTQDVTVNGMTYKAGAFVIDMHQISRSFANAVLYKGKIVKNWTGLFSESVTNFPELRGFDCTPITQPGVFEGKTVDANTVERGIAWVTTYGAKATIPGFDFKIQWIIEEGMYGPEEVYNDYEALFNVEYGDSLITASYAADGDFTTYTKGGSIISAYPQEATVLMRVGSQDDFYKAGWWNGIDDPDGGLKGQVVAIDYQSGGLDMTVFCTSITNKAHQTDDYRLATNAIYSKLLGADFTVSDAGQDEPVPEPVPEPSSPRTGDDMNVVAWTAAAVLSMGMAAVFTTRKKAR